MLVTEIQIEPVSRVLCRGNPEYAPFQCMLKSYFATSEIQEEERDFADYRQGGFHGYPGNINV